MSKITSISVPISWITKTTSLTELNIAIKNLNNKTSQDEFQISNLLLKHLPTTFKFLLVKFYNDSLHSQQIPAQCKSSIITMIPKKGDKANIKNYRPISSTSCIMKLFEKIIHKRITNFLTLNNVIIRQQSGFRSHRQCKDNLIFICQKILETYGQRRIFFDIQSAFDKLWYKGLIYKLIKIGTHL